MAKSPDHKFSPLRSRFLYDELTELSRPLLGENFILEEADLPSLRPYRLVHQEVSFRQTPLAIVRRLHFLAKEKSRTSFRIRLTLCLNGFQDALEHLFFFAEEFERPISLDAVIDTAENYELGDFGIAWAWQKGESDIVAFVRNNVFIAIQGIAAKASIVKVAQEIDKFLSQLRTVDKYFEEKESIFFEIRSKQKMPIEIPAGETLAIGTIPKVEKGIGFTFFLTTSGSMNRNIANPNMWYYRAGMDKGQHTITLLYGDAGVLPKKAELDVIII